MFKRSLRGGNYASENHHGQSKQTLLHIDNIPVLHVVVHGNPFLLDFAIQIPAMTDDAALSSLARNAASGSKRLNDRHPALQAVLPGLLYLPVEVDHVHAVTFPRLAAP